MQIGKSIKYSSCLFSSLNFIVKPLKLCINCTKNQVRLESLGSVCGIPSQETSLMTHLILLGHQLRILVTGTQFRELQDEMAKHNQVLGGRAFLNA